MKNSILEIIDQIESLEHQLKNKDKDIHKAMRESKLIIDEIFLVETSIAINKLKLIKIKHEAIAFLSWHSHKKIEPNL